MRALLILFTAGALGACAPDVPDSGFDAMRSRELARAEANSPGNGLFIPPTAVSGETLPPAAGTGAVVESPSDTLIAAPAGGQPLSDAELAAETAAALAASSANSGVPPVNASPANPPPAIAAAPAAVPAQAPATVPAPVEGHAGLSRENDFGAVSNSRSIEGDAEQIARNREQYQQIAPTALPTRDGSTGPNIVTYALETTNERGTALYKRSMIIPGRAQRACAGYPSPDQAQIAFLAAGGPERDRHGLDPDGDGFACSWNPAPFRAAKK
ncbi:hypothetical protein [Seohaeicola zhoushanensis]|uniref:Excalibur calcium-binding domain-containing protein n=1 Tax=Seohaeicola zhoushanensis TaxID=1569283 RepID=A0A8J3H0B1_9RHOB|nr:hypothetical protein [Seohaeicola zhoushanensis]GHF65971.1 hypothetical protein GCM10017056_41490 [Seohaeicola zhoushanensis]